MNRLIDWPTLHVLWIGAVIYGAFLLVAQSASQSFVPRPMPPEPRFQLLRFEPIEGFGFRSRPGPFMQLEDKDPNAQKSPVILYEDDKPIGPAHSQHFEIEYVGQGRYSHSQELGILMSTSDNTNPGSNGRLYWVALPKK